MENFISVLEFWSGSFGGVVDRAGDTGYMTVDQQPLCQRNHSAFRVLALHTSHFALIPSYPIFHTPYASSLLLTLQSSWCVLYRHLELLSNLKLETESMSKVKS